MEIEKTIKKFRDLGYSDPEIRCAMNQAKVNKTDNIKIKEKSFNNIIHPRTK